MGAVIGKQNGHVKLRSVVGVLAAGALAGILAGLLSGAVALGVAELAAAIIGPDSAPVIAVGETAINLTPIPVKDFAITHFGSHDKQALVAGILVMLAGFAALIGAAAVRRIGYGLAGLAVFAGLGVTAALRLPGAGLLDVVPTLTGVTVAAGTLVTLVRSIRPRDDGTGLVTDGVTGDRPDRGPGRRLFLAGAAGAGVLAAVAGGAGDVLLRRFSVASSRAQVRLPAAAVRAPAVPTGTELRIPGLTPFFTSNASFYRVDTDLVLPEVAPETWTLRIDGMVAREIELSFAELLRMPLTERPTGPSAGTRPWPRSTPSRGSTCPGRWPRSPRARSRWPGWPGRPPPASPAWRSARTTVPGTPPGWPPRTASTPGGSGSGPGTRPPGCTRSRSGPPTTRA